MEVLNDLINKRMASVEADIMADTFASQQAFDDEIERLVDVMVRAAFLKGIEREKAKDYVQNNFVLRAQELYNQKYNLKPQTIEKPNNYAFEKQQEAIEELINDGEFEKADQLVDEVLSTLEDENLVEELINDGELTREDIDYFKNIACSSFEDLKNEILSQPENQGFFQRVKNGLVFIATGQNPYDNQTVKIRKTSIKEQFLNSKLVEWAKKHKVAVTAGACALLLGTGLTVGKYFLHNQSNQASNDLDNATGQEETQSNELAMAIFEVDEYHNFNINDQNTHTLKLQLLAQAMMERGVPVVSEEECMRLELEGKLAISPKQLNNWLISINLEDMNDLTFTKLLADSETDKEELSSDFLNVNRLLGKIYTTKEDIPFIYEFISNKEYSEYIKIYEEAIIENQKGNSENLIALIKNRVSASLESTSTGPLGILTNRLIYLQANVYNPQVIGQDIMDLYNIDGDCKTADTKACFYSDNWAEYMRKVNQKLDATISYTGTEAEAYAQYFLTLSSEQMGNKVDIEEQVLPYLENHKVQLGKWDVLEAIANYNVEAKGQSTGGSKKGGTSGNASQKKTTTTVSKVPTTEAEKKVQAQVEADLEKENQANLEKLAQDYAKEHGGLTNLTADGDIAILTPEGQPIIVDTETKGAYDSSKDYQGKTYNGYGEFKEEHRGQVQRVEGVGDVVVTEIPKFEQVNTNVYIDSNGNIIDKTTGKVIDTGSKEEIDNIINRNPGLSDEIIVKEGEIHYSEVDSDLPQSSRENMNDDSYTSSGINQLPGFGNIKLPENQGPTDQQPINSVPKDTGSVLDDIDQNILGTLTPEEQAELEAMLKAGQEPMAGEIVDETYSDVVYGNYTVPQLMSNPALCQNIPENILRSGFPDIWNTYQNWLASQRQATAEVVETQAAEIASVDIAAQIAALETEKAQLTGTDELASNIEKTL